MLYILLQYLHWPELNIRKLGCHHRKEQKSSEKHPALHIKILLFQRWLWSFTVHVYFWAILFILKQFYYTDSSVYIYIYRQLEMKLSNSVIMPSINSPQFVIYLASRILKAYVQSIYCSLTSFACFVHRVQFWYVFWLTCIDHEDLWVHIGVTETYLLVISSTLGLLLRSPGPSDGALSYLLIKESTVCIGVTAKTSKSLS